jgi:glycosyltransferase involved in cell wall biosynthesis
MPTVVLDLDFENLPTEINELSRYNKALILIRFRGNPAGKITLPVINGSLCIQDYYENILSSIESDLWVHWLHNFLEWDERDVIDYKRPTATVAICTRDRTDDLRRTLNALMAMPDDGQEILVIDNAPSTDETKNLCKSYQRVKYVLEKRPGLNIARNRALLEAKNEIVAFTDDDAAPDSLWLRALLRNFNSPRVMCVTGLTMPLELETKAQETFEQYSPFGKGFKRRVFSSITCNPLATGKIGAGANMALRRSVQQLVGLFDEALDAGTPTHSGGDHEIFARILLEGYHIIYDPNALSWHRHRRTWDELRKTLYGYGVGVYALLTRHLLLNRELSAFKIAYKWFRYSQLPTLLKSIIGHPKSIPTDLIIAELRGCLAGPKAYFSSRNKLKAENKAND